MIIIKRYIHPLTLMYLFMELQCVFITQVQMHINWSKNYYIHTARREKKVWFFELNFISTKTTKFYLCNTRRVRTTTTLLGLQNCEIEREREREGKNQSENECVRARVTHRFFWCVFVRPVGQGHKNSDGNLRHLCAQIKKNMAPYGSHTKIYTMSKTMKKERKKEEART